MDTLLNTDIQLIKNYQMGDAFSMEIVDLDKDGFEIVTLQHIDPIDNGYFPKKFSFMIHMVMI